jgi:hypothetical protein
VSTWPENYWDYMTMDDAEHDPYPAGFCIAPYCKFLWFYRYEVVAIYRPDPTARHVLGPFWRIRTAQLTVQALVQHFRNGVDIGRKQCQPPISSNGVVGSPPRSP